MIFCHCIQPEKLSSKAWKPYYILYIEYISILNLIIEILNVMNNSVKYELLNDYNILCSLLRLNISFPK